MYAKKVNHFYLSLCLATLMFLFSFIVFYNPTAHATVYFSFDAENGIVGADIPNPPFCQTECSGSGAKGTYQSSGGAPQGSQYFQWQTVANQHEAYTVIGNNAQIPPLVSNALGNTYYLAFFFNFTRINGQDVWHECTACQSADKTIEIDGSGIRWVIDHGQWEMMANTDHHYTVFIGNPTYHLNPQLEHVGAYWPNQNGYTGANTIQLQYERWYSAVMAIKVAADNTGYVTFWIDGVKIGEYNNIITSANSSPDITMIRMNGTIAQGWYDAPAHYRKFDALMLTDNWQDIVDRGYLSSDTPPPSDGGNTPPPSSGSGGDSGGGSGGSGCGFVKDDGIDSTCSRCKGQGAKGEGLSLILLFLLLILLRLKKTNQYQWRKAGIAKTTLFFTATALIFLLFAGDSDAADYYVSPTGSATWSSCTNINTPCSWQTAMANAVADDIVYFRGGTYNVGVIGSQRDYANMRPANSGTSGHPITFIAYPAEVPNITGTVINGSTAAYFGCSYNDYITWDGFAATMQIYTNADGSSTETQTWATWGSTYCTIRNSNFTGVHQPYYNNTSFVRVEDSNYTLVENNYFHDLTAVEGVSVNAATVYIFSSSYTTVRNNTMQNTYGGVFMKFRVISYTDIHNNFIYNAANNGYVGIQMGSSFYAESTGNRIHNNIIIGNGTGINMSAVSGCSDTMIYNNVIYSGDNTHDGIYVSTTWTNVEIFNNIIANLSPSLRYYDGIVSYSNYNNFYRATGNVWNRNWTTDYTTLSSWTAATGFDLNSITSNPLFVNAGGASPADYKLQATSPARTSGRGGSYATVMGAYITGNETIGYDPDAPRVEITSPASSTVTTTNTSIALQGTASDTQGIISVTCNNSRGGNCTCTGTINWTCSNIPLQSGQNIITVTATDGDNKTGIDVITVTVSTGSGDTGGNGGNNSGGGDTSSGGSGCGFVRDDGKGQGGKGKGVSMMILLIMTLLGISLARRTKRRA